MAAGAAIGGAVTVLSYIDIAIKVATFLVSERLPATVNNIMAYFSRNKTTPPAVFQAEEARGLVALLVIDPGLLDHLTGTVSAASQAYMTCLRDASTVQEKAACDRRAERDICDTLNRIRDRNADDLPTGYLRNQWTSYGCIRV